jgi:hypothetical protein
MHRTLTSRWLSRALRTDGPPPVTGIPEFLCPAIRPASVTSRRVLRTPAKSHLPLCQRRYNHVEATIYDDAASIPTTTATEPSEAPIRDLPVNCPGCGAFSQTQDSDGFGYYSTDSKRIQQWLHPARRRELASRDVEEEDVVREALKSLEPSQLEELGLDSGLLLSAEEGELSSSPGMPAARVEHFMSV